jgi:hypothetical protein
MGDPLSDLPARARTRGSSLTDTQEGRRFFAQRLSVLGLCIFALSGGFQVVQSVLLIVLLWGNVPILTRGGVLGSAALLQFGATATAGLLWWITRRRSLPASWLPRLDVGATLLMCGFFQASSTMESELGTALALMVLTTLCALGTRAIVVPSGVRRTLAVSVVCSAPIAVLTAVLVHRTGASAGSVVASTINGVLWGIVLITISTVASRTIFDLRREVGQARVLGQYTLEEKIGSGGMGEVWRASHAMLRRPTAIKLLPVERTGEASLQRFEREVQLTARLTHPNTVSIFDYGRALDGVFYFAMELLDGIDLERLVDEHGPLPPERVVHVLRQVCGALAEAHAMGLVHRDVKPANVILMERGGESDVAKVVDFGLVKELEVSGDVSLTGTSAILGTPLYLSPEAIVSPSSVDAQTDIYALGAVGWFLLAGRPVFDSDNLVAVCSHHLSSSPQRPSARLGRPLPSDLEDVLLRCLDKDRNARPAGARALRDALDACECAGRWTEARAAGWWAQSGGQATAAGRRSAAPKTLAIDLSVREAVDATVPADRLPVGAPVV